jgi:hypothetical protein
MRVAITGPLYEVARQLKTTERQHEHDRRITIKRYEWVVTASNLTWQEAKAQCKSKRGARIYPMRQAVTA